MMNIKKLLADAQGRAPESPDKDLIEALRGAVEEAIKVIRDQELRIQEAKASGKAARRLAKEMMRAHGKKAAHVRIKADGQGLTMVICSPPAENEDDLGRRIAEWIQKMCGDVRIGEPKGHVGESES